MPRAKGIQIYLKPGIEEDDLLLSLWEVCKTRSRPQEMFRRLLTKGFYHMVIEKDISDSILDEIGWDFNKPITVNNSLEIEDRIKPKAIIEKNKTLKKGNDNTNITLKETKNNEINEKQDKQTTKNRPSIGKDLM